VSDTNDSGETQFGRGEASGQPRIIPKSASEALRPEQAPQPPSRRRSRKARSQIVIFLNFVMTVIVFATIVGIGVFYYGVKSYEEPGPLTANTNFIVRAGAGTNEIAANLERNNIISDSRVFRVLSRIYLDGETLKAGEYEIKSGATMREIVELLKSGKSILYSVSVPEGLTVKQVFKRLTDDPVLEGDLPADLPAEGSLMPDTYKFSRGTKRADILHQMQDAQKGLIDQIWERRDGDLPIATREEFVTLASIVEKETGRADERSRVASVFLNRLDKGMRLQSDPTIIYGIFGGEGKPADRPIFQSDL
jgi:UPF0755 protein